MSLVMYRFLLCDHEGCDEEYGPEPTAAHARGFAIKRGWVRRDHADFCPTHAASAPEEAGHG